MGILAIAGKLLHRNLMWPEKSCFCPFGPLVSQSKVEIVDCKNDQQGKTCCVEVILKIQPCSVRIIFLVRLNEVEEELL